MVKKNILNNLFLLDKRSRSVVYGVVTGVFSKGAGFFINFLTVPVVISHVGISSYGSWVVIISLLAWLGLSDLGIANGLVPLLTKAYAKEDFEKSRIYVATAFYGLLLIALLLGIFLFFLFQRIDFSLLFNSPDQSVVNEAVQGLGFAITIFLFSLPLSIVQRIYLAHQQGGVANLWQIASAIAGAAGIFIGVWLNVKVGYLIFLFSGFQFLVLFINGGYLFYRAHPNLNPLGVFPKREYWRDIFGVGGLFFLNQIATLVVFQKDTVLVSHYYGVDKTAAYSLVWQIFLYLNFVNLIVAPYVGPAFGEAYAKKDYKWMARVVKLYLIAALFISLPFIFVFVLFYKQIIEVWTGKIIDIDPLVPMFMGTWVMVMSFQWPIISLLNGIGRIKVVTYFYIFSALLNIPLSLYLIGNVGIYGGILSSSIVILLFVLWPSIKELKKIIDEVKPR